MTTADFEKEWQDYGVEIDGVVKPIKNFFMMCWGPVQMSESVHVIEGKEIKIPMAIPDRDNPNAPLMFDEGGEQGAGAGFMRVEDDNLISVNPDNFSDTKVIGKLVKLWTK